MTYSRLPIVSMLILIACAGCSAGAAVGAGADPAPVRGAGKPGAAITLTSSLPSKTAAATPIDIAIQVVPGTAADSVRLDWMPSAGLQIHAPAESLTLTDLAPRKAYRNTVTVSAATDGVYHLGVLATLTQNGVAQTRAFSIRVAVGTAVVESKPALNRDSNQQLIESMPARESVPR